jgi:hypothetical protein
MSTGNGHCSALQGSTSSPDEQQHTPVTFSSQSIAAAHKTGRDNTQVLTYYCQGVVVTENLQREGIRYEISDSHKENSDLQNGFHKVHRTSEGFALRSVWQPFVNQVSGSDVCLEGSEEETRLILLLF